MSFGTYKVYEKQEIVKLAIKAILKEDLESFKSYLNSIKEDLNKYPVYREANSNSSSRVIIALNTASLLEYAPKIYLSDEFGYVEGYCSFVDYFLVNAISTLGKKETNDIFEYILSLEDIDYCKLTKTIDNLIEKSKFKLLKRILLKHDKLDYRLTDYSTSAHARDKDDCIEFSVLESIMLGMPGYNNGFGIKHYPIDKILCKLLKKEKDIKAFYLINNLLSQYPDSLYGCYETLEVLISYLSNGYKSCTNSLSLESIMQILIDGNQKYGNKIYCYSYIRLDKLLSKINSSEKWDYYFKDFIQLIPNTKIYKKTFLTFYQEKMYNYLESFINIYDKDWFLNEIRENYKGTIYVNYIKYMLEYKNDYSELIYAYNDYFNENIDRYNKLSMNLLYNLMSDYLIDLYKKEKYELIKNFFNFNSVEIRFIEYYLKYLISKNDIDGIKFVLSGDKPVESIENKESLERLIVFARDSIKDKRIEKYLIKILNPSIIHNIQRTFFEIKNKKENFIKISNWN